LDLNEKSKCDDSDPTGSAYKWQPLSKLCKGTS
jgi:hypothetical protein